MSEQEWKIFVDTGLISLSVAKQIAEKITSGEKLNPQEVSVYACHSTTIETQLQELMPKAV